MDRMIVRHKETGERYQIQYAVHGITGDVYAAYRISGFDGKPIGPRVWIHANEFVEEDLDTNHELL